MENENQNLTIEENVLNEATNNDVVVSATNETNEVNEVQPENVVLESQETVQEEIELEETDTTQTSASEEEGEQDVETEQVVEEIIDDGLSEDERLALELQKVNAELADLEAEIEHSSNVRVEVHNFFDTQEGADEVGISGEYDDYGREILDDVFENRLRMSTNGIKLAYSKVKNTVLSYKNTKQRYDGIGERYTLEKEKVMLVEISGDSLYFYLKAEPSVVEEYCPYTLPTSKAYKEYDVCITIKRGKPTKKTAELSKLVELIDIVMANKGGVKRKVYVPVPYAERYPVNPEAVLRGNEGESPIDGIYDGEEYDPIDNELTRNIIIDLMGEEFDLEKKKGYQKLEALRQQAETIRGAVALTEPIIYFYGCGLNTDSTINYLNVQQVLNDKFLGKLLPPQYVAIAENSERIEELNLIALQNLLEVMAENEKYQFALPISCRTFVRKVSHGKLIKMLGEGVDRLILAIDGNMLLSLGKLGIAGVDELRKLGVKIMIDYGVDTGVHLLTDYAIDYLRIDARYYKESDIRRTALLDMLVGYAKVQGIPTVASGVEDTKQAKYFLTHGIDIIEGFATGEPKRTVLSATKEYKKLPLIG